LAHDLTAVVSQLALGDLGCHTMSVAQVLHSVPYPCRPICSGAQSCTTVQFSRPPRR
jgi:hypothetical protein